MTVDILFPYYGDVAMMKQAVLVCGRSDQPGLAPDRCR